MRTLQQNVSLNASPNDPVIGSRDQWREREAVKRRTLNYEYRASNLNEVLSEKMLKDTLVVQGESPRNIIAETSVFIFSHLSEQ